MRVPNFEKLREQVAAGERGCHSYAKFRVPNPRFYKYYWWVFWSGSPCDGRAFLTAEHRLPTKAAFDLMQKLDADGELYWLYNTQLPRRDPGNTPFDPKAARWEGVEWAPAFDQDPDAEHDGYK